MIQRIQSLYLLLAFVLCVVCLSMSIGRFSTQEGEAVANMYNLWLILEGGGYSLYPWALFAILLITSTLSFLSIFLFSRRALQMRVVTFCIILLVGWYVAYAAFAYLLSTDYAAVFRPNWSAALPAVGIILHYLAFRGIMRDEMLVRSLDRLR